MIMVFMEKCMYKYLQTNLIYFAGYFVFLTLANSLYSLNYWPLYVGGMLGLFLPNLDHLLHVFILSPQELTSLRVIALLKNKQIKEALNLLYDTREERKDLMFHTILFQIIFTVLTFWVVSSSGNLFGRGLVLAYFLNLTIFNLKKMIKKEIILEDSDKSRIYFAVQVLLLFVLGLMI